METINLNDIQIGNTSGANAVNAPNNQPEIKNEVENTSKDTQESTKEQAQEQAQVKHVVTYIGGSEFTDSTGNKWHKHDEKTYSDKEYNERVDLHFMVNYGEMKHTVVTM